MMGLKEDVATIRAWDGPIDERQQGYICVVAHRLADAAEKWAAKEWYEGLEPLDQLDAWIWMESRGMGMVDDDAVLAAYRASQEGK